MSAHNFVHAPTTRENLERALRFVPPHLRPIFEAVRDCAADMMFVPQSADAFRLPPKKRPAIIIVGDDFDRADGPTGFHMPSIRRAIRACRAFAVISSAPPPAVYATIAATAALTRQNTMLVETRPKQEIAWIKLIQKLAPGRFIWLATVEGGHA